jgi:hypothetical protein
METMSFAAEIVRRPEGTYEAVCAATPGCRGMGPTQGSALEDLRGAVRSFLEAAIRHAPQVEDFALVVVSRAHASLPSERQSGQRPSGGWKGRNSNEDRHHHHDG